MSIGLDVFILVLIYSTWLLEYICYILGDELNSCVVKNVYVKDDLNKDDILITIWRARKNNDV